MGVGLCMRVALRLAVLSALLSIAQIAPAQNDSTYVDANGSFFGTLSGRQTVAATGANKSSEAAVGSRIAADRAPDQKQRPALAPIIEEPTAPVVPPPPDDELNFKAMILDFSPVTWGMLLAGLALTGMLLWTVTPLPCLLLGHRRCSKSVRFNDHEDRWVGNCKSCGVLLARDRSGAWTRAKPTWRKPEIVASREVLRWPIAESSLEERHVAEQATSLPAQNGHAAVAERGLSTGFEGRSNGAVAVEERAQKIVSQLLEDVGGREVLAPGTRGALFSVVDELRARCATDEHTLCAEKISIRMQQLECALHGGDEKEAKLARRDLRTLAQEWVDNSA